MYASVYLEYEWPSICLVKKIAGLLRKDGQCELMTE